MNILLCFDDMDWNYTRHAAVTILSLLETNKKNKIKIWIISSCISQENIEELKRIVELYSQEIEFIIDKNIVPEDLKKVIINKNNLTRGAWYRYFFKNYIKDIDRILYIDCDVLIMKDIYQIYNMNMHWKSIAWWYVCFPPRCLDKIYGIDYYFNSWVMLFDVKKYDSNKITVKKIKEINNKYSKYFTWSDEEKINIIFKDDIYIAKKWMNYQIINKWFNKWINDAEIIHCLEKPYKQYSCISQKYVNIYYNYLNQTKRKGYPETKVKRSFWENAYITADKFIFNLLVRVLWDKYMEKLIRFKWKIVWAKY